MVTALPKVTAEAEIAMVGAVGGGLGAAIAAAGTARAANIAARTRLLGMVL
jgi:hypothetical protein